MNNRIGSNPALVPVLAVIDDLVGHATSNWRRLLPSTAAAVLGIAIIAAAGFAPGIMHQAAHDVRHTMAFQCH